MATNQQRAVVLLSGGMDSCVCAALAARDYEAAAVHVSYGQRTEQRERQSFLDICERLKIHDRLTVRNEALRMIGGSALTDASIAVPDAAHIGHSIPVTYVPFRNAHFLSVAVSWAEVLRAQKVYIGAVEPDASTGSNRNQSSRHRIAQAAVEQPRFPDRCFRLDAAAGTAATDQEWPEDAGRKS